MKIKRYLAETLPEAMALVRQELGSDAVILGTRRLKVGGVMGMFGRAMTEVAAVDSPDGLAGSRGEAAPREALASLGGGVSRRPAARNAPGRAPAPARVAVPRATPGGMAVPRAAPARPGAAQSAPRAVPACRPIRLEGRRPRVVCLVGPSGAGKTTTCAKLAGWFASAWRARVAMVDLDSRGPGSRRLRAFGRALGVEVREACTGEELGAVLEELGDCDLVLVDTPGLNFRDRQALFELGALLGAGGAEVHLVMPLNMAEAEAREAARAFGEVGFDRLAFTKADEAQGQGLLLGLCQATGAPVSYVAAGQRVPEDIQEATPAALAALLVGSVARGAQALGR